jgi:hypothetical protein
MGAMRQLRRKDSRRVVHTADSDSLKTLRGLSGFADNASPFVDGWQTSTSEAVDVQKNFAELLFVWHDKPKALCRVEPLNRP